MRRIWAVGLLAAVLLSCVREEEPLPYKVFVTSRTGDAVTVVRPSASFPRSRLAVGDEPTAVTTTRDGELAFVANSGDGSVSIIDARAEGVTGTVPTGGRPVGLAVDPEDRHLLVADGSGDRVVAVDIADRRPAYEIAVGASPRGIAFRPDSAIAYVACAGTDSIDVIDTRRMMKTGSFFAGTRPAAVTFARGRLWVASESLPVVYTMVPGGLRDSVVLPAAPHAIAADTAGNFAYVTSLRDEVVVEIDLAEVATGYQVAVGQGLAGIAVSPNELFYYVAVAGEDRLAVVDQAPDMPTQTLDIPGQPWGVAIADLGRPELLDTGVVATARELSLDEFAELIEAPDVVLINVQAEPEGEIEGTDVVVSYDRLLDTLDALGADRTDVLAVYCREGAVSGDAALALAEAGYADVCWLQDGYDRWVARGMPFRVYRVNRR